ncbi:N-methyl-L-tryptophan oxidase [Neobacillus sp. NPDC093127]|uniref:N-methyl-L-tryptophan oxidase n=1 Tax=Neobacillus sp. NPDC093127 TaxID=3364296 RepID=UPI00381272D8
MTNRFETIVIGAGSMGMSTGYFLAKRGVKTLLIDAFDPPHTYGSHHGDTRMIRHAYGEGASYVPLVLQAQKLWGELEEEAGERLFYQTGVLNIGKSDLPFVQEVVHSAETHSLSLEYFKPDEIMREWPGIHVPEDYVGCYESSSGVLLSETAIAAYRKQAQEYGAELRTHSKVRDIQIRNHEVQVKTDTHTYYADSLVLTAGAWMGKILADTGLSIPVRPIRKTISWFACNEEMYKSDVFPAFNYHFGGEIYYGFPSFDHSGLKVGRHDQGIEVDPDCVKREFGSIPEDEEDVRRFLKHYMREAEGKLLKGAVCMYTVTPDEHFIIDHHPNYSHVVMAGGFSGHGFKFASAIGEQLSQLVIDGTSTLDLSLFSLSRFNKNL